jgi:hypothetical protein
MALERQYQQGQRITVWLGMIIRYLSAMATMEYIMGGRTSMKRPHLSNLLLAPRRV